MTLVDVLGSPTHDLYVRRWGDGRPHRRLTEWPFVFQTYEQLLRRLRQDTGDLGYWHDLPQDMAMLQAALWMTGGMSLPPPAPAKNQDERRIRGTGQLWAKFGVEQFQIFGVRRPIEIDDEDTEPEVRDALKDAKKLLKGGPGESVTFQVAVAFCPWMLTSDRGDLLNDWVDEHREREPLDLDKIYDVGLRVDIAPQGLGRAAQDSNGWLHPGMTIVLGFKDVG